MCPYTSWLPTKKLFIALKRYTPLQGGDVNSVSVILVGSTGGSSDKNAERQQADKYDNGV